MKEKLYDDAKAANKIEEIKMRAILVYLFLPFTI